VSVEDHRGENLLPHLSDVFTFIDEGRGLSASTSTSSTASSTSASTSTSSTSNTYVTTSVTSPHPNVESDQKEEKETLASQPPPSSPCTSVNLGNAESTAPSCNISAATSPAATGIFIHW